MIREVDKQDQLESLKITVPLVEKEKHWELQFVKNPAIERKLNTKNDSLTIKIEE